MEKLSAALEAQVKALVKAGKTVEAVALVQKELQLGLKNSKDIVDRYR